ncbi:MAG: transposase [candidate division KSB1 bacterium]|nr:transposase [candidate division KSB1 bacterium]MDZ7369104.1 transposase [candidate division KSB1 bacterium]MDZ7407059.1 transposase [candidate division KSB1 bacterium]
MSKPKRHFSAEFKAKVILEVISGAKPAAEVCREHNIKPQLLSQWKSYFLENAVHLFDGAERRSEAQARVEELERVLGQKTLEVEILKKASNILPSPLSGSGRSL